MSNHDQLVQARFDQVIDQAQTAFWEAVAAEYTEAKTGDLSPDTTYFLEKAMKEALYEWVESNTPPFENKTVEVLLHNVEYWYTEANETVEVNDSDIEHIAYQISQGIGEGELNTFDGDGDNWSGWWIIKK